jgi:hypothetical protein
MGSLLCCCWPRRQPGYDVFAEMDDWMPPCFPRSTSAEVSNDPRIIAYNVIEKRMAAFQTITVASILLTSSSCAFLFEAEYSGSIEVYDPAYWSTLCQLVVFCCSLQTVIVLSQQYYHVFRLMTAGPTGFETVKEYYMDSVAMEMRHMAVRCFTVACPCFVLAVAFRQLATVERMRHATWLFVYLVLTGLVLISVTNKLNSVFSVIYGKSKLYEDMQFAELSRRQRAQSSAYQTVSGY